MATRRGRYSLRGPPAARDDDPIHERFLDSPILVTGIPLLRSDSGRPQTQAAIARFFASRGRTRLSHDDALIVQQILAAAVGVDRNHWAYRDGIVGPRTRALLRRAMAEEGENSLRELQRRLQAAGLYSGEIDGVPGPLTLRALTDAYARAPDERRRILEGQPPLAPEAVSAEEFERRFSRALQSDARGETVPDSILADLSEAQRSELERRRTVARDEARLFNEEHGHVPFGAEARAEEERQLRERQERLARQREERRAALEEHGRQLDGELDMTLPTPPASTSVPLPERLRSGPDAEARARAWTDLTARLRRLGYPVGNEAEIQQSYLRSRLGQEGASILPGEVPAAFDREFDRFVSDARTSMPIYRLDGQRLMPPPLPTSVISPASPEADPQAVRARMRERMRLALARLRLGEAETELGTGRRTVRISDDGQTATIGRVTLPLAVARQMGAADGFAGIVRRISALAPGGPPHRDTDIDAWAGGLTDYFGMDFGDNPDAFLDAVRAFRERVLGQPPANLVPPLSREQLIRHGLGALLGVDPRNHALIHTALQEAERARLARLEREAEALAANMAAPPPETLGADEFGHRVTRALEYTARGESVPDDVLAGLSPEQRERLAALRAQYQAQQQDLDSGRDITALRPPTPRQRPLTAEVTLGRFLPPGAERNLNLLRYYPASLYRPPAGVPYRGRLVITSGHEFMAEGIPPSDTGARSVRPGRRGEYIVDAALVAYMSPAERTALGLRDRRTTRDGQEVTEFYTPTAVPEQALTPARARRRAHLASLAGYEVVVLPEKIPDRLATEAGQPAMEWRARLAQVIAGIGPYTALISDHLNYVPGGGPRHTEIFANAAGRALRDAMLAELSRQGRTAEAREASLFMANGSLTSFLAASRRILGLPAAPTERPRLLVETAYLSNESEVRALLGSMNLHNQMDTAMLRALGLHPDVVSRIQDVLNAGPANRETALTRLIQTATAHPPDETVARADIPGIMGLGHRPSQALSPGGRSPVGGTITVRPGQLFTPEVRSHTVVFPRTLAPMTTRGHSRQVELTLSRDFDPTRAATITIFFPGHGARIGPGGRHDITGTGASGQNVAGQFLNAGVNGLHIAPAMGNSDPGRFRDPGYLARFLRHAIEQAAMRAAPNNAEQRQAIIDRLSRADTRVNLMGYSGGVQTVAEILRRADHPSNEGLGARIGTIHLADGLYSGGRADREVNAHVIRDFLTRHTGATLVSSYTPGNTASYNIGGPVRDQRGRTIATVRGLQAILADVPNLDRIHIGPVPPAPSGQAPHETLIQRTYEAALRHAHGQEGAQPPLGPVRVASLQPPSPPVVGTVRPGTRPGHEVRGDPRLGGGQALTSPHPGTLYYNQRTGQLHDHTGRVIIQARSGRDANGIRGLNNPDQQFTRRHGPLPATLYRLDAPGGHGTVGWGITLNAVDRRQMRGRGDIVMHEQFYAGSRGCIVPEDRAALNVAIADIERLRRMAAGSIYLRAFDPENLPPELEGQEWARVSRPLAIPSSLTAAIEAERARLRRRPEGRHARQRIELTVLAPLAEPRRAHLPALPNGGGLPVRVGYEALVPPAPVTLVSGGAGTQVPLAQERVALAEESSPQPAPVTLAADQPRLAT